MPVQQGAQPVVSLTSPDAEEARIRAVYARREPRSWRYSPFNPAQLLSTHEVEAGVTRLLRRHRLEDLTILDIGCGGGSWLRRLIDWGARPENLTGIDLLPDRIAEAIRLSAPSLNLICGSAAQTGLPSASFDLIFQFTVFTSILDVHLKHRLAAEMLRLLKPSGVIVWYDYHANNPRNHDVRGVKKPEIRHLFPRCEIDLQPITLAPPISRFLSRYSPAAASLLGKVPLLCTHYLGSIRPPGQASRGGVE